LGVLRVGTYQSVSTHILPMLMRATVRPRPARSPRPPLGYAVRSQAPTLRTEGHVDDERRSYWWTNRYLWAR